MVMTPHPITYIYNIKDILIGPYSSPERLTRDFLSWKLKGFSQQWGPDRANSYKRHVPKRSDSTLNEMSMNFISEQTFDSEVKAENLGQKNGGLTHFDKNLRPKICQKQFWSIFFAVQIPTKKNNFISISNSDAQVLINPLRSNSDLTQISMNFTFLNLHDHTSEILLIF